MKPPIPSNESARLSALQQYHVLDTAPEAAFDELAQLAAQICQTPMASITFIDANRQWHKSNVGLEAREIERDVSFCAHTINGDDILLVPDATADERFRDNPLVTAQDGLRFYAGMPLITPEGLSVGSLCAFDTVPHQIREDQLQALRTLGRQVVAQLELRPDFGLDDSTNLTAAAPRQQSRSQRLAERRSERRQAAEILRSADERYRGLFEATQEGILIVDVDGGIIEEANHYLGAMLSQETSFLVNRRVWQIEALRPLFPSKSQWNALCRALREAPDVRASEVALPLPDGGEIWVEMRAHFSPTQGREIARFTLRDITQSRLARESLRAQEEHHRTLLKLSLNAVVVMNDQGRITQWNPAAETMFGRARAEVLGLDLAETIVPPGFREQHRAAFERHLRTGESHILNQRIEVSALRADGSEFPVELAIARDDTEGGPIFLASLRDITSRHNARMEMQRAAEELEARVIERTAELRETNARLQREIADHQNAQERLKATARQLRGVLESISDAFVSLDAHWRFTYINEPAQRLMNKTRDELMGREIAAGFPGGHDALFDEAWRGAIENGQPITRESYYAPWKMWLELHAYPSDEGLSIYFQDISARRAAQFALEEAKREADAANEAKSEFLGRISHELRTPLNAILGFGQILDRQNLDELQRESVGYILKSGNHLLELINEVLDISRVETGHLELNLETCALQEIVAEACALVRPLADARSITLHLPELKTPDETPFVCADAQRVKQVMINLLSNAIKYNFDRGEVAVSWDASGADHWQVSVRDSGPGISPKNLPRLFVPFDRGAATDSCVEGTGLGLSLTLSLVEAMDGKISVQSTPGRGSTFSFSLPRAPAPDPCAEPSVLPDKTTPEPSVSPCAYRVLCIEDNLSNRRLVELTVATRPEVELFCADHAQAGLQMARQHEPDLILLDLNLPDMHGSQVLQQLQQSAITRDIPVIIVSADATAEKIDELLDMGASQYLTKPLDMRKLLQTLDKMLCPMRAEATPR